MNDTSFFTPKRLGILAFSFTFIIVITTWIVLSKNFTSNKDNGGLHPTTQNPPSIGICEIDPSSSSRTPLLVYTINNTIAYPESTNGTIKIYSVDLLEFSCPTSNVTINGIGTNTTVEAVCKSGDLFEIGGRTVQWNQVSCTQDIRASVKKLSIGDIPDDDPNKVCYDNKTNSLELGLVGFQLDSNRFVGVLNICFNTVSKIAVYSNHILTRFISSKKINESMSGFTQDEAFYNMGKSIDEIYKNSTMVINSILGLENNDSKYINNSTFINRGHLAPKADFCYAAFQMAVQRYINVAPQWNSFNNGNWRKAEENVRTYAVKNSIDLQIWTGTYGNCMLENKTLYLYKNDQDTKNSLSFPVPKVFWKIVYNPVNATGIILVGHNNPYSEGKTICTDVSSSVSWLTWDSNNIKNGYSYACNYNDTQFHDTVQCAPKLTVKGLL